MSQIAVQEYRDRYFQGQVHNPSEAVTENVIIDDPNPIYGGYALIQGANDKDASLPVAAFTFANFKGFLIWSESDKEKDLYTGVNAYLDDDSASVLLDGQIAVKLGATVTKDQTVFFVHTAGGASPQWTYRADLDTDKASECPAIFSQGGIAGDIVLIRARVGAKIAKQLT